MKRIRPGFHRGFAAVLPLLLLATSCSREEKRVVAPEPPLDPPHVATGRWIWEPDGLAGAVREARSNPVVQRALATATVTGLTPRNDLAVRAVGVDSRGLPVGLTILPFSVGHDSSHAAFISVAEGSGRQGAEFAEMIVGREPRPDEVGFTRMTWGDRLVWVRTGDAYELAPGMAHPAPMKRNWAKLFTCLAERMPIGCAAGADIADDFAPGNPRAAAVGCAIGAAAGGLSCALEFMGSK
jgi:hypothetical protein